MAVTLFAFLVISSLVSAIALQNDLGRLQKVITYPFRLYREAISASIQAVAKVGATHSLWSIHPELPAAEKYSTNTNSVQQVQVSAFGHDVTPSEVKHVESLIRNYKIVNQDAKVLNLRLTKPVQMYLAQNESDYQQALAKHGLSIHEADNLSHDTGGFTLDNTVVIPLYQNQTDADLINTIAHEITHVFINDNSPNIPSWINEGIAVYNGMGAQRSLQGTVTYNGYARRMAESVLDAASTHNLLGLTDDENSILYGKATYDLELQDWLGVSYLVHHDGLHALQTYFQFTQNGEGNGEAFLDAFGESESDFNTKLTYLLRTGALAPDKGVSMSFTFPANFKGQVRLLQHGSLEWQGFDVSQSSGLHQVKIDAKGHLTGTDKTLTGAQDDGPPDNATLFINLEPSTPLRYNGQLVQDSGYAIDYHDGLYGFLDAWVTFENGKSLYFHDPVLVGTTITSLNEASAGNPIEMLLNP